MDRLNTPVLSRLTPVDDVQTKGKARLCPVHSSVAAWQTRLWRARAEHAHQWESGLQS